MSTPGPTACSSRAAIAVLEASLKKVQHTLEPQAAPRVEPTLTAAMEKLSRAMSEDALAVETVPRTLRPHAHNEISSGAASAQRKPLPLQPATNESPPVHTPHQVNRSPVAKPFGRRLRPLALALVCGAAIVTPISLPSFQAIPFWDAIDSGRRAMGNYAAAHRAIGAVVQSAPAPAVDRNDGQSNHVSSRAVEPGVVPLVVDASPENASAPPASSTGAPPRAWRDVPPALSAIRVEATPEAVAVSPSRQDAGAGVVNPPTSGSALASGMSPGASVQGDAPTVNRDALIGQAPFEPAIASVAAQVGRHDPELATSPLSIPGPTQNDEGIRATASLEKPDPSLPLADQRMSDVPQAAMDPLALHRMRTASEALVSTQAADDRQSRSASQKPPGEPDADEHAARYASLDALHPATTALEARQAINPVAPIQSASREVQEAHLAAAMPLNLDERMTGGLGPSTRVGALAHVAAPRSGLEHAPSSSAQAAPSNESSIEAPPMPRLPASVDGLASDGSSPGLVMSPAPTALASNAEVSKPTLRPDPDPTPANISPALPQQQPSAGISVSAPQGGRETPQTERLLTRARMLLDQRDVSGARLILEHLVRGGSGLAAFLLARTYDPRLQGPQRGYVIYTDPLKADGLYRLARDRGVVEAADRVAGSR